MIPTKPRLKTTGLTLAAGALALTGTMASADQVINDDLIVIGSACIGFDCANGLNFGFDTLILKENNTRLLFDDTSNSASFPRNDWRLGANDTTNGGAEKFFLQDATANLIPFTVEAAARNNALYVESDGDIGIGTNNPAVDLTIVTGNTPTLRLQQDGSSGFTPQSWDVAGNEAGFFIRDVTNGSQLPFRIIPGADNASLVIDDDNDVGIGAGINPNATLHVRRSDGTAQVLVEEASGSTSDTRIQFKMENNGAAQFAMVDTSTTADWRVQNLASLFRVTKAGTGVAEMQLDGSGNMTIRGTLTTAGNNYPDYVFAPDYELMPLTDVRAFITENGHLPNVPSADEVLANGLNLTEMHIKLMEKVEELTLYTLQQQTTIDALQERLETLAD